MLDGVDVRLHAPATLPPGKTRYQLYTGLGGTQGRSGWLRKISSPPEFDPRTVQLVVSRYTDWDIPAPEVTEQLAVIRYTDWDIPSPEVTEQLVVSRYTDWDIPTPEVTEMIERFISEFNSRNA